jgi:hypothetical protein
MVVWLLVKHTMLLLLSLLRISWRIVFRGSKRAAFIAAAAPAAAVRAAGRRRTDSLEEAADSPLPDEEDHAAEPLLSDEEEEQRTAQKRRLQQRLRAQQFAAQQLHYEEDEEQQQQQQQQPPVGKVSSFSEWAAAPRSAAARAAAAAAAAGQRSPLHLRQGPPLSPTVLAVQPNLQQRQWRQQEVAIHQHPAVSPVAAAAAGGEAGGYRFPSSTTPGVAPAGKTSSSPWSQDRLVMDISNRQAVSPPAAPQLSPGVPAASPAAAAAAQGAMSPLVQQGKILNPLTNKAILLNKATYNMLVSDGYTPDLVNGVMLPPGEHAAAAARPADIGGSSGGRAVTPGSQVRQRSSRQRT